ATGLEGRHAVLHSPAEGEEEGPGGRELLDAAVEQVGDEDVPAVIHGNATGVVELPDPAAQAAPRGDKGACVRELLDAVVPLVGDEDVAAAIGRHAGWTVERSVEAGEKHTAKWHGRRGCR